jgi:hypothetical protein
MNNAYTLLCAFSISLIFFPLLHTMEEKEKKEQLLQIDEKSTFYTDTTRDLLRKTFHVIIRGEIPSDTEDLTFGKSGRRPEAALTTKIACPALITCRMNEHVLDCADSNRLTEKFLNNGQLLTESTFNVFVDLSLEKYSSNQKKITKLKKLNDYLIEAARNAYRQQVINIQNAYSQQVIDKEENNLSITQDTQLPSKPWYKKLAKKAAVKFQSYLPLTAQHILFVDMEPGLLHTTIFLRLFSKIFYA